jgi:hypothetical protein
MEGFPYTREQLMLHFGFTRPAGCNCPMARISDHPWARADCPPPRGAQPAAQRPGPPPCPVHQPRLKAMADRAAAEEAEAELAAAASRRRRLRLAAEAEVETRSPPG